MLFGYDQPKSNLGFAEPILLNLFLQNENIKLISKLVNLKKKKKKKKKSHIHAMLIKCFTMKHSGFTNILKVKICGF